MRAHDLQRLIRRRALIFGGVQLFASTALVSRLYYLQFVRGAEFKTLAEDNRVKLQLMMPPRGVIADRNGVTLAGNHVNYRLMLEGDSRKIARKCLAVLIPLMKLSDREVRVLTEAIRVAKVGIPM